MRKTAVVLAALITAASVFTSESASAQTIRKSKGDIYAEYVTTTYNRLCSSASTYYGMCSGRIEHSGAELISASNDLATCELAYYYACKTYNAAPTRSEIIDEEKANGSNCNSSGSGTPGDYTAKRIGDDAHAARLAAAYRTRETPKETPYLTRPSIHGMVIKADSHGVYRYTLASAKNPKDKGYRNVAKLSAPSTNPYMVYVMKKPAESKQNNQAANKPATKPSSQTRKKSSSSSSKRKTNRA